MVDRSSLDAAVERLRGRFGGDFLRPGDPQFDEARRVHNGLIDRKPALIARCRGTADIVDAAGYNLLLVNQWAAPSDSDRCMRWGRETFSALQPFRAPRRYVNYLDQDEGADAVAAAYGSNYRRLRELKTKYDPDNWFHLNQNIPPLPPRSA